MGRLARTAALTFALVLAAGMLAGCQGSDIPEPSTELPEETAAVSVFFATGRTLVEEPRIVDAAVVYEETLDILLEATPEIATDVAIVQPVAAYRSITLDEDGVLTVDWEASILDFEAEPGEKRIALAAFLTTLGQFEEVEGIRFTVEGKEEGEIGGKDIQTFWGSVGLVGQPWDPLRPGESTSTVEPDETEDEAAGDS